MLHIDLQENGLTLNGVFMPEIDPDIFIAILGEPRKSDFQGKHRDTVFTRKVFIWDELGFLINIPVEAGQRYSLECRMLANEEAEKSAQFDYFRLNPKGFFTGTFTLNGKEILHTVNKKDLATISYTLSKTWKQWQVSFELNETLAKKIKSFSGKERADNILPLIENEAYPFESFWFSSLAPKAEKQAKAKYDVRKATADDVVFDHFPFKLAVVQALMYEQEILKPKFDVHEFCAQYTARDIDPNDYNDEMIPEVKKWFADLPIPKALAEKVTELSFDGGNDICLNLIPQWHGEDDQFCIRAVSAAELAQFPNLDTIDRGYLGGMRTENLALLESKGIRLV